MRFVVDEMPHSANCDCPFAEWKPNPPCFEEIGQYVCKNDNKKCDRNVSECRWMIQMPNKAFLKEQEPVAPTHSYSAYRCGKCECIVGIDDLEGVPGCKSRYCADCGRKLKLDEKEG